MWERVKDRWNYAKAHPWEINLKRAVKNGLLTGGAIGGGILLAPFALKFLSVAIPGITHLIDGAGQVAGDVLQAGTNASAVFAGDMTQIAADIAGGVTPPDLAGARRAIADMLGNVQGFVSP